MKRTLLFLIFESVLLPSCNQVTHVEEEQSITVFFSVVNSLEEDIVLDVTIMEEEYTIEIANGESYTYWQEMRKGIVEQGKIPVDRADCVTLFIDDKEVLSLDHHTWSHLWSQVDQENIRLIIDPALLDSFKE